MGRIIFVTGGARSGKSRFAEKLARDLGGDIGYVATAVAFDDEMKDRIKKHRQVRPPDWTTWEKHRDVHEIYSQAGGKRGILIDCLTVLVTNLLLDWVPMDGDMAGVDRTEAMITEQVERIIKAARASDATTIIVSNEVGMGLVPDNILGRVFRDIAGRVNQLTAQNADDVYFVVSGIPMKIK